MMAMKNSLSFMHKLNVDKNYFTMGTFDVQAKPINIQCEFGNPDQQQNMPETKPCFPSKLKCKIRVMSYHKK